AALAAAYGSMRRGQQSEAAYQELLKDIAWASPDIRKRVVEILSKSFPEDEDKLCAQSQAAAIQLQQIGDWQDAESALFFAGYKQQHALRWSRVAVLNLLSSMLESQGRTREAISVSTDALALARAGSGIERDGAVGDLFMRMGEKYARLGNLS